jgi:hypothetical protein
MIALPICAVTDPQRFVRLWFRELTPIIALYSAPVVLVLLVMWLTGWPGWHSVAVSPALEYLWAIVLASVVAFVLTSLRPLLFLGEAERYFEYSAPAFCILLPVLLVQLPEAARENWLWVLLLLHLAVVYSSAVYVKRADIAKSSIELPGSLAEVIDWCGKHLNEARVAPVPMKLSFALSYALRDSDRSFEYYYRFILRDGETGFRSYEEDTGGLTRWREGWSESLDVFKIGPEDLSDKYGITHLLVSRRYAEGLRRTWGPTEAAILDTPIFENDEYTLCAIPQARETIGENPANSH